MFCCTLPSAASTFLSHALLCSTQLCTCTSTRLSSTSLYSIYSAVSSLFLVLCPTYHYRLCFILLSCDLHRSTVLYFSLICFVVLYSYSTLHEFTLFYSRSLSCRHPVTAHMPDWTSSTTCIFAGLALQKIL